MDGSAKAPVHLWIVAVLATVWNAFGAFDYIMTQTRNEAYLAHFTDPQRAYFDSFPMWMEATWAFGVWGGMAGSLLLLLRSRYAVAAFAVSLAGLAASTVYQYVLTTPPSGHDDRHDDRDEPGHLGDRDRAPALRHADAPERRA